MTTHANRNFSFRDPASVVTVAHGDTFRGCNLHQLGPGTAVCAGRTGLKFEDCNLINATVPPGSTVTDCNTRQISRCAHLHPDWGLPSEPDACPHVVDTEEIEIDGQTVTIYAREDTSL